MYRDIGEMQLQLRFDVDAAMPALTLRRPQIATNDPYPVG